MNPVRPAASVSPARPAPHAGRPTGGIASGLNRELARLSWWQVRHSGRMVLVLLVALVPLAAGIISVAADANRAAEAERSGAPFHFDPGYLDVLEATVLLSGVPLCAVLLAGGLIADDLEDRTLSYLLVRPLHRRTLYLSKLLPVAGVSAGLNALQALLLGLCRIAAWVANGQGTQLDVRDAQGAVVGQVGAGAELAMLVLGGMLAAALLGAALAAMFGFVSLALPRFHFVANAILYLAIELPFSRVGGLGLGFFTVSLHASNLVYAFDLTGQATRGSDLGVAGKILAAPMLVALTAAWVALGVRRVRKQDFNVGSASS